MRKTPCEKLGYKAGDRFTVIGSGSFTEGSEVEPEYDDGSSAPLFKLISGDCFFNNANGGKKGGYCSLIFVTPVKSTEWNGEGLPPIGCEARCIDGIPSRNKVFSGTIVKVISNCKDADGDDVTVGHHRDIGYVVLQSRGFVPVKTEAQRLSEAASIKLKTAQKVIDAGYRKESV